MKKAMSLWLCAVMLLSLVSVGGVSSAAAVEAVDFLRQGSLSCVGVTANMEDGALVITATASGQEAALTVSKAANLTTLPYWDGIVEADIPFDIVYYDKTYAKWIYASANFCYDFEQNNGASNPLPAARHQAKVDVTGAYTWNGGTLPSDAAVRSVTFIAYGAGTIRVERCAMTDGTAFAAARPSDAYRMDQAMIKAIPLEHTVGAFCDNARLQFDTFKTTVKKPDGTAAKDTEYIGTGDAVTFYDGAASHTYTAVVRGDLNASGTTTTTDVMMLLRGCIGGATLTDAQTAAADIVSDRRLNTTDAMRLLRSAIAPSSMKFTQESVVDSETFLSQSKYNTFLSASTRGAMLAGLKEDLVPQGLAQCHKTGYLYMSAYSSSGDTSAVLVFDADGRFRAEYLICNPDGTACKSHLGGVAVSDTTLFLSYDGNSKYRVAALPLADLVMNGSQTVVMSTVYEVPVATSFLSYYDGYLWMGNFYLPSSGYDLMRTLNYTTEGYGCYIAGFDLRKLGNDRLLPASGQSYAAPDVLMAAPQKVQGMAFDTKTNTVILSHSWGRKNDSSLTMYTVNLKGKATTNLSLAGVSVPCFVLSSPKTTVTALPMSEGISLTGEGAVNVLFESGANKYSDGLHRTDCIWLYRY